MRSIGKNENIQIPIQKVNPGIVLDGELYRSDANKIIDNAITDSRELAIKGVTKGKAVDKLLEHLGASIDDTIAIGDGDVDIPLLEHCKIKVAMGNASDGLKAITDLVTDPVDQDGLFKAFVKLGLIEE